MAFPGLPKSAEVLYDDDGDGPTIATHRLSLTALEASQRAPDLRTPTRHPPLLEGLPDKADEAVDAACPESPQRADTAAEKPTSPPPPHDKPSAKVTAPPVARKKPQAVAKRPTKATGKRKAVTVPHAQRGARRKLEASTGLQRGDLVWAKIGAWPYWPGWLATEQEEEDEVYETEAPNTEADLNLHLHPSPNLVPSLHLDPDPAPRSVVVASTGWCSSFSTTHANGSQREAASSRSRRGFRPATAGVWPAKEGRCSSVRTARQWRGKGRALNCGGRARRLPAFGRTRAGRGWCRQLPSPHHECYSEQAGCP